MDLYSIPSAPFLQCRPLLGSGRGYGGRSRYHDTGSDPTPEQAIYIVNSEGGKQTVFENSGKQQFSFFLFSFTTIYVGRGGKCLWKEY